VVGSVLAALLLLIAGLSVATVLTAQAYERERQKALEADEQREQAQRMAREADHQRDQAQTIFMQAHQVVDEFTRISEEELTYSPFQEGARRRLLEAALTYYRSFLDQHPDDPWIASELQSSRERMATIINQLTTIIGAGRYRHLHDEEVQKELHLDEHTRQALRDIDRKWHQAPREIFQPSPEGEKLRLALAREQEAAVGRLLKPEQLQRLKEIALQDHGPAAFRDPEVVAALQLTERQRERIRAIEANVFFAGPHRGPGHGPPHGEQGRQAHEQARKAAMEQIEKELTPEQVAAWKNLIGKPFTFRRPAGPRDCPDPAGDAKTARNSPGG
jgi:hypothetical protein